MVTKVDDDTPKRGSKEEGEIKGGKGDKFDDAGSDIDTREASTSITKSD